MVGRPKVQSRHRSLASRPILKVKIDCLARVLQRMVQTAENSLEESQLKQVLDQIVNFQKAKFSATRIV